MKQKTRERFRLFFSLRPGPLLFIEAVAGITHHLSFSTSSPALPLSLCHSRSLILSDLYISLSLG